MVGWCLVDWWVLGWLVGAWLVGGCWVGGGECVGSEGGRLAGGWMQAMCFVEYSVEIRKVEWRKYVGNNELSEAAVL